MCLSSYQGEIIEMKVLLAVHYNLNNGDKAVFEATLSLLKKKYGDELELTVSSFEPIKTETSDFKVVSWGFYATNQLQRRLLKLAAKTKSFFVFKHISKIIAKRSYLKAVKEADIVYISGGHHLTDLLGDDVFYSLVANIFMGHLYRKPMVFLPQTMGDLKNPNKLKIKLLSFIISNAKSVAYRDNSSYEFLEKLGLLNENCKQIPDVVYSLPKQQPCNIDKKSIGVALYGNYSGTDGKKKIEWYSDELAKTITILAKEGYLFHFIPMEVKGTNADDRWIARRIIERVDKTLKNNLSIVEPQSNSIFEIIRLFGENEFIFAYKTHSVVFSMIQNKPLVAIAYHKKAINFMSKASLDDYAMMDKDASCEKLLEVFNNLKVNYNDVVNKEKQYIEQAKTEIYSFLEFVNNDYSKKI